MKYESNTPMYSKDIAWKTFFVRTGEDVRDVRMYGRTDKGDAICPPHPIINGGGIIKNMGKLLFHKSKNIDPIMPGSKDLEV